MNLDIKKVNFIENASLKKVLVDGVSEASSNGDDGFEYFIGEAQGYSISVVCEPIDSNYHTSTVIDKDCLGYRLLCGLED